MSIQVNNLFYFYNKKTPNELKALNGVNLEIEDHCFTSIVGETGSGKSTLVQHLNGLLVPASGSVHVDEFSILPRKNKNFKKLRQHVGVVFQFPEYQLFEETVIKDVAFGPRNFGFSKEESFQMAKEALQLLGIDESYFEKSPLELSGGEKRKVALAGILAIKPDIIVLDEPTAGLDVRSVNNLMNVINELYKQGKSIIAVTHDMDFVLKYSKEVIVMYKGEIKFQGRPIDLFKQDTSEYGIEVPPVFKTAYQLKQAGFAIDFEKLKDTKSLVDQLTKGGLEND